MKRFTIGPLLACVFFFSCILVVNGCTPTAPPVQTDIQLDDGEFFPEPGNPKCGPGDNCCPTELAGRYHQRKRTKRFFGRVA